MPLIRNKKLSFITLKICTKLGQWLKNIKHRKFYLFPKFKLGKSLTGFTLAEILITIAIIGLLIGIAIVSLNNARVKSRDAKKIGDIVQISKATELSFSFNDSYPNSGGPVNLSVVCMSDTPPAWCAPFLVQMPNIPDDPLPSQHYVYNSDGANFRIGAILESSSNSDIAQNDGGLYDQYYEGYNASGQIALVNSPTTTTIEVAAVTSPNSWLLGAGADKIVAVNSPDDDDTTYIKDLNRMAQQYSLASNSIPTGATINSVSVFSRCKKISASGASPWFMRLSLGASSTAGPYHVFTTSYVSFTDTLDRPGVEAGRRLISPICRLGLPICSQTKSAVPPSGSSWTIRRDKHLIRFLGPTSA